jgi:DNA-binding CsgD family transcriptional regulator
MLGASGTDSPELPASLRDRLQSDPRPADASGQRAGPVELEAAGRRFVLTPIGRVGDGELLVTIEVSTDAAQEDKLRARFGLTARECEVLVWITRGKSNRDIGDILDLSPRTVNKHLERIYVKLGVENRASAAAIALGALGDRAA